MHVSSVTCSGEVTNRHYMHVSSVTCSGEVTNRQMG